MKIPFENPLFLIPITTGFIFMVAGCFMLKFPPKKINYLYGYRTNNSMKNQRRWNFAQKYSAKELIKLGGILTLSSLFGCFYFPSEKLAMVLGLAMMLFMVVILFFKVEGAIKKEFDNDI